MKPATQSSPERTHYTDATEATFRLALKKLETELPNHHAALVLLVDEGRFHLIDAIDGVLAEGGAA
jgi:hypothetical protein